MADKAKIGDIYVCKVKGGSRYFQYICNDSSQLGSQVIAVFKENTFENEKKDFENIQFIEIDFFAHVAIALGVKMGCWHKLTNTPIVSYGTILFRDTNDYGNSNVRHSDDWWVWEPNKPSKHVGSLVGELRNSFIGVVMAPPNIVARLTTGKYSYAYPAPVGDEPYWE